MNCRHVAMLSLLGISLGLVSGAAAADPFGFYVGGAVGEAHVRFNQSVSAVALQFDHQHSAWKILAGMRPISLLGAEVEYIDFGRPTAAGTASGPVTVTQAEVHSKAESLSGLVYLPLPVPFLDVYGKAGYAHLQNDYSATGSSQFPPGVGTCTLGSLFCGTSSYQRSRSDSHLTYGAGVQVKLASLAVRAEYQRISASTGDPDLLSLGLSWGF